MTTSWTPLLTTQQLSPSASLDEALDTFKRVWKDYGELETPYVVGFSTYKIRAICRELYDRLATANETAVEYQEMRRKLLEMAGHPRQLSQHLDERFGTLGDEVVALIEQVRSQEASK